MSSAAARQGPEDRVRVPKTSELVAARLRASVLHGDFAPGELLPTEAALVAEFNVSRPTLREALRVLEAEALIEVQRGNRGGARVMRPDGQLAARYAGFLLEYRGATLSEVFEAAAVIEVACVADVARGRSARHLAALTQAAEAEEGAESLYDALAAENSFHALVVRLSGNTALLSLSEMVRHIIDNATRKGLAREGRSARQVRARHRSDRTHRRLVELIGDRDPDGASELWGRHLRETRRYLSSTLGDDAVIDLIN